MGLVVFPLAIMAFIGFFIVLPILICSEAAGELFSEARDNYYERKGGADLVIEKNRKRRRKMIEKMDRKRWWEE